MKIHGKVLTHFLSCSSPVDKEGYLYKKGERNTSYQKRWFILKGNLLFYKDRPADRELVGLIVVDGCTVQLCESEEQYAFSLVWSGPGLRTYKLAAEDQPGQEAWIKALLSASHGYLTLLVRALEAQHREVMAEFSSDPAQHTSSLPTSSRSGPGPGRGPGLDLWSGPGLGSGAASLPQSQPGAGHSFSTNQMLQPSPILSKSANKKSPKPRPKRNANVAPLNGPTQGVWSGSGAGPREDFSQLHEDFGKEVKQLIADWLRRGREHEAVQEEDLIDLG